MHRQEGNGLLKNVDAAVKKETAFIACIVLIGSVLMQSVFLIIGKWDYTVLLGNLLGAAVAVGNFFLMGITIQKSLELDPKDAAAKMKVSQKLRLLGMIVVCALGAALPWFHLLALVVPLLLPRLGITIRGMMIKRSSAEK